MPTNNLTVGLLQPDCGSHALLLVTTQASQGLPERDNSDKEHRCCFAGTMQQQQTLEGTFGNAL